MLAVEDSGKHIPKHIDPAPIQKVIVDPEIAQPVADHSGHCHSEQQNALPVMPRDIVPANSNKGADRECIKVAKRVRIDRKSAVQVGVELVKIRRCKSKAYKTPGGTQELRRLPRRGCRDAGDGYNICSSCSGGVAWHQLVEQFVTSSV